MRPHDGHVLRRRRHSSALFCRPACVISHPAASVAITSIAMCRVSIAGLLLRVGMRLEIQLAPPPIGYVGVQLGGREIGVSEHLLHGAQIGAALQQMRCERVPQQVRMHTIRLEARGLCELPED